MRPKVIVTALVLLVGGFALAQEGLDALEPNLADGAARAESCMGCHGAEGVSSRASTPNLAGQYEGYLRSQLVKFRSGERENRTMNRQAGDLTDQEIVDLAAFWSSHDLGENEPWADLNDFLVVSGEEMYFGGAGTASRCAGCHGDAGQGSERFPRLWGLPATYVQDALHRYRDVATDNSTTMHRIAANLTDLDIWVVSEFIASNPWGGDLLAVDEDDAGSDG